MYNKPSTPNERRIRIVEIINPEFLTTLLNLLVCAKLSKSNNTSVRISTVKNSCYKFKKATLILGTCTILKEKEKFR